MESTLESSPVPAPMAVNSRHLSITASRIFDRIAVERIEKFFDRAVEIGGLKEIGFDREPGVSYNPRPARIAIILMKDLKTTDPDAVCAGILASVLMEADLELDSVLPPAGHGERILEMARTAKLPIEEIEQLKQSDLRRNIAAAIACALFLDLMRHFHQTDDWKKTSDKTPWLEKVEPYIRFSSWAAPVMTPYFQTWSDRLRP